MDLKISQFKMSMCEVTHFPPVVFRFVFCNLHLELYSKKDKLQIKNNSRRS